VDQWVTVSCYKWVMVQKRLKTTDLIKYTFCYSLQILLDMSKFLLVASICCLATYGSNYQ